MPDITELPASPEVSPTLDKEDVRNKINEVVTAVNDLGGVQSLDRVVARLSVDFNNASVNNAYQAMPFNTASYNPNSSFIESSNHYLVPSNGDYHTDLVVSYVNNGNSADDRMNVVIRKNGTDNLLSLRHDIADQITEEGNLSIALSGLLPNLVAGDVLTVEMYDADDLIISLAEHSSWSIQQLPTTTVNAGSVPVNDQQDYIEIGTKLIQSGTYTGGSHNGDIVFPTPFANAGYQFIPCIEYAGLDKVFEVTTSAKTPSQIHFDKVFLQSGSSTVGNASGESFDWIAIGTKPQS